MKKDASGSVDFVFGYKAPTGSGNDLFSMFLARRLVLMVHFYSTTKALSEAWRAP